jgi:zinc and cadmium transporter
MGSIPALLFYSTLVMAASVAGGELPSLLRLTHTRSQILISFVAGFMLGIGLFHLLPHSISETASVEQSVWWVMTGLLTTFLLVRIFHFHSHAPTETSDSGQHPHDHDHDHDQAQHHPHPHDHGASHRISWMGMAIGLSLHTLMDGIALAAGIQAEAVTGNPLSLPGLGIFVAILLHKPLDAMSITSLMAANGWSPRWCRRINCVFALLCPLGAVLFWLGVDLFSAQQVIIGCALAFSAGVFLCISLGDLLPEVQFHSHDQGKLTVALLLGIAFSYGIGALEPAHQHSDRPSGRHENRWVAPLPEPPVFEENLHLPASRPLRKSPPSPPQAGPDSPKRD